MFKTPSEKSGVDFGLRLGQGPSAASPSKASQEEDLDVLPSYRSVLRAQQEASSKEHHQETLRKLTVTGIGCLLAVFAGVLLYTQWPRLSQMLADLQRRIPAANPASVAREKKAAAAKPRRYARAESVRKRERASQPSVTPEEETITRPPLAPYQFELTDSLNRRWLLLSSTPEIFAPQASRPGPAHMHLPASEQNTGWHLAGASFETAKAGAGSQDLSLAIIGPLDKDEATYPRRLLTQFRIEHGSVVVAADIGPDGATRNLRLVSGSPVLAGAILGLLRQLRFERPAGGDPAIESERLIRVDLSISAK